ncbi:hypothetical protein HJC23_002023 [Cyclotella cryptica]|uniref:RING-type domain-containing protein n=1 Tax=Cyclotella cryptica TaxID=29204 RepID=A0ABD3NTR1_9STRA|eukprot:CCRYP_019821-RA/>CCRYP_019821-RA protein AED:0.13 eAED:0.13 QI:0/-1/0/1/-1/1/1/0/611
MSDDEANVRRDASTVRQEYHALLSAAASTAGSENWKTCAGRLDGPDGFIPSDLYNCMKRSFRRRVKGFTKRTRCPVCMEDPLKYDDSAKNGWYITKSCNHSVCKECLQSYASSQISDPNHSGPLKCPCCPRLLRVEDVKVALSNPLLDDESPGKNMHNSVNKKNRLDESSLFPDPDHDNSARAKQNALQVLKKWDDKVRDEFLRSMPEFRPCPHCSKLTNSSNEQCPLSEGTSPFNGGGFVTHECLSPVNEERESFAERVITFAGAASVKVVLLAYTLYYMFCSQKYSAESQSREPTSRLEVSMQIVTAILPAVLVPVLPHVIRLLLAKIAKGAIIRPIIVTCPCCNKEFNLEASSELNLVETLSTTASEYASRHWKNMHTRPCPGCSSPILKDGGCNHVRCGKCGVNFCWACMRCKSLCKAYQCKNGAPYGNAFGDGSFAAVAAGLVEGQREGRTLMEHIEAIELEATSNLQRYQSFITSNGAVTVGVFAVANFFVSPSRLLGIVASTINMLMVCVVAAIIVLLGIIGTFLLHVTCFGLPQALRDSRRQAFEGRRIASLAADRPHTLCGTGGILRQTEMCRPRSARLTNFDLITEEEMVVEAITRSLVEQ